MKKILLVSNLDAFIGRNKNLLNRAGFRILTATSAEGALRIFRQEPVDLIISLLDLPGMGGDALCSLMRQDKDLRQVPIILVCYDSEIELERASHCGANACVIKPVRPDLLLKQIGRFLDIPTRREYRASFNAKVIGRRGSLPFTGMTRNISVSGILCETEAYLSQDDLISNLMLAIDTHQIDADGKVVWSQSQPDGMYNYGVQFTRLAPACRERIENFVTRSGQS